MGTVIPLTTESSFRRGFHQGYDKAIDDVFRLLKQGMSQEQAYRLLALQCNLIGVWRNENRHEFIAPPAFNKTNLLETLEMRNRPQLEEAEDENE